MLKAYALALALSTAAPVAEKVQEGASKMPVDTKEVKTELQSIKPITGGIKI